MLKKYESEPSHVINFESIQMQQDLSYEERPLAILETKEKALHNRIVRLVKVLWEHHDQMESTWETTDEVKKKYPHLFQPSMN